MSKSDEGLAGTIRPQEPLAGDPADAARKRAAVELLARHEATLMRTARRFSLCGDDAEDALQRALEILLTKAPTDQLRELVPWMQTVTKHEALAIRRKRERLLGTPPRAACGDEEELDWLALVPAAGDGPPERAVRREAIARSREALRALKPAELRALTLLAEGYSYAEISEITGFSRTKVNRCLAEGRERFRRLFSESEAGGRCDEIEPVLSAYCDGEASPEDAANLREHLRACGHCRSVLRSHRAATRATAVLAPGLPLWGSIRQHVREVLGRLRKGLPRRAGRGHSGLREAAGGGGAHATGLTAAAKLAACAGTVAATAACVAGGVLPAPTGIGSNNGTSAGIVRQSLGAIIHRRQAGSEKERSSAKSSPAPRRRRHRSPRPSRASQPAAPTQVPEPTPAPEAAPAEYQAPPPQPAPAPEQAAPVEEPSGSAAGEFGP